KSLHLVGEAGARLTPGTAPLQMFPATISEIDFGPFPIEVGGILTAIDCDVTLDRITVDGEETLVDGVLFLRAGGALRSCRVENLCRPDYPRIEWAPGACVGAVNDGTVLRSLDVLGCSFTRWNDGGVYSLGGPNPETGPTRMLLRVEDCTVAGAGES